MSLQKRMFRSNMTILFAALLTLLMIIAAALVLSGDSLENQLNALSETRVDEHAADVLRVLQDDHIQTAEALQKEVGEWDYQAALIAEGRVVSGEDGEQMHDLAEFLYTGSHSNGQVEVFTFRKATAVGRNMENGYLVAVRFPETDWLTASLNSSFFAFLATVLLAGIWGIFLLLILSSFFTKRMNRTIMEPVALLEAGAKRVRDGNLKEDIDYHGDEEFEHMCNTFNDMQHTILEDQRQRIRTERARTDMVTGISHDLRTPLTSIQGYIKGIMDGVADTEEKRNLYLKIAYESTKEMNTLLQKLFDFSRMESGKMPFHLVNVDLAEYTAAYVAQKEAAGLEALQFTFHVKKEWMPEVSVDVDQIRRVFDNLLENSMKYAGVQPVKIQIEVSETEEQILLTWKDNGQGVPEEKLGKIFDRFYRCDEARQEKGSGVGLYVAKYIMERHGGTIAAVNDGGLKLTLSFPKSKVQSVNLA